MSWKRGGRGEGEETWLSSEYSFPRGSSLHLWSSTPPLTLSSSPVCLGKSSSNLFIKSGVKLSTQHHVILSGLLPWSRECMMR